MNVSSARGLTVVMPIGHLKNDFDNILRVSEECQMNSFKLILILDDQPLDLETMLLKSLSEKSGDLSMVKSGIWRNPGAARNYGLTFCSTDWVAFWDSDDSPNFEGVSRLLAELNSGLYDVGLGEFQMSKNDELLNEGYHYITNPIERLEVRIIANPGVWRFIFNRNFVNGIDFAENSSAEDQLYLQRLFALLPRIKISNEKIYTYVVGGEFQLTRSEIVAEQTLKVLQIGVGEISSEPKEFAGIRIGLIIKQLVSVLKHGNIWQLVSAIRLSWQLLAKVGTRGFLQGARLFYRAKKNGVYFCGA